MVCWTVPLHDIYNLLDCTPSQLPLKNTSLYTQPFTISYNMGVAVTYFVWTYAK